MRTLLLETFYFISGGSGFVNREGLEIIVFILVIGSTLGLAILTSANHLIVLLMLLEVVLVTLSLGFALLSVTWFGTVGLFFSYILLILIGGESALALSVVTAYFFVEQQVAVEFIRKLKG